MAERTEGRGGGEEEEEGRKRGGEVKTAEEEGRGVHSSSEWKKTVVCMYVEGKLGYSPALCSPSKLAILNKSGLLSLIHLSIVQQSAPLGRSTQVKKFTFTSQHPTGTHNTALAFHSHIRM